ncbi:TOMM precursor leader peptide-binding protein [Methylocystis rosea]|uniref:TOMM precursor leader peptide-binding protein n=1 Tax=Methylocystis rosea TaxID=173366 RepID=UPI00036D2E63|nr:TOMM precursor leader peptide-binding protein [Methylocystis rosea]
MTIDVSKPLAPKPVSQERLGDALRFAPNFSVYVLPPDAVCLYSEDRKFFLRGALYCALAERIGAGEDTHAIRQALSAQFPVDSIDEAFKRLFDRRFVVPAGASDGVAAAYWASLGLQPEVAAKNLQKVSVQIEAIGIGGARELEKALDVFGVKVVKRGGDLTIALVGDYLEGQLAEFNRRRLEAKQDWLLVQPSGVFPLVGPIFSPGKSACWRCLADRMNWNRQVKAFLGRKEARCVAVSPLGANPLGLSGAGIAAAEIAKAIASGFRTDLHEHIVSLDLMGSTVARHYVPARPQCPSCGDPELRDPARTPTPIPLHAGSASVVTSGGYRSVAPGDTLARNRKHVSPLTGVVSHLDRIKSQQPLDASFIARHNFSPRPETVDALQAGLSGDSYGKGSVAEQGEASALMEAIERYCGIFQGDEIRIVRRFADFPAGEAILPDDILLYSDAQYEQGAKSGGCGEGAQRFDPAAETEWSPVWSLRDECFKYVPTGLLYFFHESGCANQISADSNGCAAGNTIEEAIIQGFLELVERDAYAIWWYNRLRRPEIDLDKLGDSYVRDLRAVFARMGRDVWALDITSDLGIPVVVAVAHWIEDGREYIEVAAGAHFDPRIATLRAMTELNQFLAIDSLGGRPELGPDDDYGGDPLPLRKHVYMRPQGKASFGRSRFKNFAQLDGRDQVLACVKLAARAGHDFLVLDQTRPDIDVPVVRVIVPGLRHFYRRFGPGRLYDVPIALGLRKRPVREADVNPLFPRT